MNTSCLSLVRQDHVAQLAAHLLGGIVALVLVTGLVAPAKRTPLSETDAITAAQTVRKTATTAPILRVAERTMR
jgi:hypothetical protein